MGHLAEQAGREQTRDITVGKEGCGGRLVTFVCRRTCKQRRECLWMQRGGESYCAIHGNQAGEALWT